MTFSEYLLQKKIDENAFRLNDPLRYSEWQTLFDQVHPESFTLQKKFYINDIRRRFSLIAPAS